MTDPRGVPPPQKNVLTYCGRPIDELSREELLAAIAVLYEDLERERGWSRVHEEMQRFFAEFKAPAGPKADDL